jgi:hypothetical protein
MARDEWAKNLLAIPRSRRRTRTENGNLCSALVTTNASMDFNASPNIGFPLRVAVRRIEKGAAAISERLSRHGDPPSRSLS